MHLYASFTGLVGLNEKDPCTWTESDGHQEPPALAHSASTMASTMT